MSVMKNISIIGDGAMGSVCAMLLCEKGFTVKMWGYDAAQIRAFAEAGENFKFLPGYKLPDTLIFEPDDEKIFVDADMVVSAVPCQFTRGVWTRLKPYIKSSVPIVSVTKGIENGTLLRTSEIFAEVLGSDSVAAALSGPTIADELAQRLPATATAACADEKVAEIIQQVFNSDHFRVYRNTDIIGVEISGAMKNVIAIAAGIIDGIKAGDNAKAALLSRGLAEIARLGIAMGATESTFAGLSGLGDLVTTCISPMGRNRSFGQRIGSGQTVDQAIAATDSVVEGVATCKSIMGLAKKYNVEMPISESVYAILFGGVTVAAAIAQLMTRQLKAE